MRLPEGVNRAEGEAPAEANLDGRRPPCRTARRRALRRRRLRWLTARAASVAPGTPPRPPPGLEDMTPEKHAGRPASRGRSSCLPPSCTSSSASPTVNQYLEDVRLPEQVKPGANNMILSSLAACSPSDALAMNVANSNLIPQFLEETVQDPAVYKERMLPLESFVPKEEEDMEQHDMYKKRMQPPEIFAPYEEEDMGHHDTYEEGAKVEAYMAYLQIGPAECGLGFVLGWEAAEEGSEDEEQDYDYCDSESEGESDSNGEMREPRRATKGAKMLDVVYDCLAEAGGAIPQSRGTKREQLHKEIHGMVDTALEAWSDMGVVNREGETFFLVIDAAG